MIGKQRRKWPALVSVGALLTVSLTQSVWAGENESIDQVVGTDREAGFWSQDVWADPARPFLFYGEKRRSEERHSEAKPEAKKAAEQAKQIEGAKVEQGEEQGVQYVKVTLDSGITFPTNGTTLSQQAKNSLSKFAGQLDPQFDLAICGHTDNTGTLEVNQRISLQRAQSVANYLTANGIAYAQLKSVKGYDYQYPVADNSTEAGRSQNRRVELYLLPSQQMIDQANQAAQ